jgi:hypothetical protein
MWNWLIILMPATVLTNFEYEAHPFIGNGNAKIRFMNPLVSFFLWSISLCVSSKWKICEIDWSYLNLQQFWQILNMKHTHLSKTEMLKLDSWTPWSISSCDQFLSVFQVSEKYVKLTDHTYACNSLTNFEYKAHPFIGNGNARKC